MYRRAGYPKTCSRHVKQGAWTMSAKEMMAAKMTSSLSEREKMR